MSAQEKSPNDPNRGLNTKVYMVALLAATLIIFAVLYFFVLARGQKNIPKANQPQTNSMVHIVGKLAA